MTQIAFGIEETDLPDFLFLAEIARPTEWRPKMRRVSVLNDRGLSVAQCEAGLANAESVGWPAGVAYWTAQLDYAVDREPDTFTSDEIEGGIWAALAGEH